MTAGETRGMLEDAGYRVLRARYWNGFLLPLMVIQESEEMAMENTRASNRL